jgi:hypothetical protein
MVTAGALCASGQSERSFTDVITGGSLTVSNETESLAYGLERVSLAIPSAAFTNALSIQHIRTFRPAETNMTVVTTNSNVTGINGSAVVSTNVYRIPQPLVTFTNTYTLRGSTNTTDTVVYDYRDFGEGFIQEPRDVLVFTITYTAGPVYLIRTAKRHTRP